MSDKNNPKESNEENHTSDVAKPLETLPKFHPYNIQANIRNKAAKKKPKAESSQNQQDANSQNKE